MSKNKKGMICQLHSWEWNDKYVRGVEPDCRNHPHLSRRRAFERSGNAQLADRVLTHVYDDQNPPWMSAGFIVEVAGQARWCRKLSSFDCKGKIEPARVNALVSRFQAMIETGERFPQILKLLADGKEEPYFY